MSDVPQGENWWQASDSKWYPPDQRTTPPPPPPTGQLPKSGRRRLIAALIVVVLILSGIGAYAATKSSAVVLTGTSSCSTHDQMQVYSGKATFEYGEPTVSGVALQGENGGLRATWTFDGPLQDEGLGTTSIFLVTIYPTRNAHGDPNKRIGLGASNAFGKGWSATAESYTTNHAVAAPIVSGNSLSVVYPQAALSGWVSQPFWWSAEEQTIQIGVPTGDPNEPINTNDGGGAIVACPSPSGGYQSADPAWTSGDLVTFPGGHQDSVTSHGSVPPATESPAPTGAPTPPTTAPTPSSANLGSTPISTSAAEALCPPMQEVISGSGVTVETMQWISAPAGGQCQYGSGSNAITIEYSANLGGSAYTSARDAVQPAPSSLSGFGGPAFSSTNATSSTVTVGVGIGPELMIVTGSSSYNPGGLSQFAQNIQQFAQSLIRPVQQVLSN
jgi:hypothetical protein